MFKIFLSLFAFMILVNGCSSADLLTQLGGKEWNVTSIMGKTLTAEEQKNGLPSLNFSDNGKLFGSTGCNTFTGSYKLSGTSLSLEPGSMTKMFCPESTEQDFLNAINKVTNVKMDGSTLKLLNGTTNMMTLIPKAK